MKNKEDNTFKCIFNLFHLFAVIALVVVFSYWSVNAYLKYQSEPISTTTELRYGEDNKGKISMPVLTFCVKPVWKNCGYAKGLMPYEHAINCLVNYGNVTEFVEKISYKNPVKGNTQRYNAFSILYH